MSRKAEPSGQEASGRWLYQAAAAVLLLGGIATVGNALRALYTSPNTVGLIAALLLGAPGLVMLGFGAHCAWRAHKAGRTSDGGE